MALHYFPGRRVHLGGSKQTGLTTSVHPKHQQTLLCKVRKLSRGLKLTIAQTDSPRRSLPCYSVLFWSGNDRMTRIFHLSTRGHSGHRARHSQRMNHSGEKTVSSLQSSALHTDLKRHLELCVQLCHFPCGMLQPHRFHEVKYTLDCPHTHLLHLCYSLLCLQPILSSVRLRRLHYIQIRPQVFPTSPF